MTVTDFTHSATARVTTTNALRYMKALCNHFDRKVNAAYEGSRGSVAFAFGTAEMEALPDGLAIRCAADSEGSLARVKAVIGDHLLRFGAKESLAVDWSDSPHASEPTVGAAARA